MRTTTPRARPAARSNSSAGPVAVVPGHVADPKRLAAHIAAFAAMTAVPGAITRLAYTPTEREAHARFSDHMRQCGLAVYTDPAGNTIAERPGSDPGLPAIGTGSHLDSVPSAGAFDGIAGVTAAMEVARILGERDYAHRHPFRFVAFAAEEGARFGQACIGSRLAAGLMNETALAARRDRSGTTIADAMRSVGLDPGEAVRKPWRSEEWAAFIELHVEQGAVLETSETQIGIVDLISGSTRLQLTLSGRASHTGATPMALRSDALAAAAEIVLIAESLATDTQHRGTRATVGQLEVHPGSITTIPGRALLSLDVRDLDSDRQRWTTIEIVRRARAVCDRRKVGLSLTLLGDTSPVILPIWLRLLAAKVCRDRGISYRVMTSGASHDSQVINSVTAAATLFIPSRHGLSHVPEEWTSASDLVRGTDTLLAILLQADQELSRFLVQDEREDRSKAASNAK